jgi:hypothetical protein
MGPYALPGTCGLDKDQKKHLKLHALRGIEIVDGVTRLAARENIG